MGNAASFMYCKRVIFLFVGLWGGSGANSSSPSSIIINEGTGITYSLSITLFLPILQILFVFIYQYCRWGGEGPYVWKSYLSGWIPFKCPFFVSMLLSLFALFCVGSWSMLPKTFKIMGYLIICYKRVQSSRVNCLFTGQYYTEDYITFTDVM